MIQYTLENVCRYKEIPFIPTDTIHITLYKKVNFDATLIERQFIKHNFGLQQIIMHRLTVNYLALNTPLLITRYVNKSIHQQTNRPQYSCHNPLNTDYNRGGEIGSQHQNDEKEDLSENWRLLGEVKSQDTLGGENVIRYSEKQEAR